MTIKHVTTASALATALLLGCAAPNGQAPAVEDDLAGPLQVLANNGWTADAQIAAQSDGSILASTTFTAAAGSTRKVGMCVLQEWLSPLKRLPHACNTVADCATYPNYAVTQRYCAAPNAGGTKYCFFKGPNADWCEGSPKTGAAVTMPASGTLTMTHPFTPDENTAWLTMGCMDQTNCSDSTLESFSVVAQPVTCQVPDPNGCADYCVDNGCDGQIDYCVVGGQKVLPDRCYK